MGKKAKIRRGLKEAQTIHGKGYGMPMRMVRRKPEENLEPNRLYTGHRQVFPPVDDIVIVDDAAATADAAIEETDTKDATTSEGARETVQA